MKINVLSILVLCCFALMPFTEGIPFGGLISCMDQLFRYQPCVFEIQNLINWRHPISTSCCTTISDFAGANCPPPLPHHLFLKGKAYCAEIAANPPPPPRSDSKHCPPSDDKPRHPPTPSDGKLRPPSDDKPRRPPTTPSDEKQCPSSDGEHRPPSGECDVNPCFKEMVYFDTDNCPISSSCCDLILKVVDRCPNMRYKLTLESNEYCKNHFQRTTPPPPTTKT
ncbi:hypothetical protein TorRG33x02_255220 [Trema orientale]|uniref:Prolamin-like domain containing protein n=1 Tax=Trema orientale TaxID=63057 RepID=A0A2P5DDA4_TREOI|nr:hypothetical protein TorRG33x02_255220 [Trema orientale]